MTYQAYRFALDPTVAQRRVMASHVGASRFAYHHLLALIKATIDQRTAEQSYGIAECDLTPFIPTSHYSLRKIWNERKDEFAPWWSENSKEVYSDGAKRLSLAMGNFFDSRKGKRKGRAMGFPRSKPRSDSGSVKFTTGTIRVESDRHHVTLPKIGAIRTHESTRKLARRVEAGTARILSATLSKSGNKWFVSFTVEVERNIPAPRAVKRVIGVDLGIKTLYVGATPDGQDTFTVDNPKNTLRSEAALRRAQRMLSRKKGPDRRTGQKASNRYCKAQQRVRRIHRETTNRRIDLIHKTTTHLAQNYDVVVIESLNVIGMVKNSKLAKAVSDAAFAEFARQLQYKTQWYGSTLVVADRWFPSSKTCSDCGAVKAKLLLSEREYVCSTCGAVKDRDLNAAVNLARLGIMSPPVSSAGAGRGGKRKTKQVSTCDAAAIEASISQPLVA